MWSNTRVLFNAFWQDVVREHPKLKDVNLSSPEGSLLKHRILSQSDNTVIKKLIQEYFDIDDETETVTD